MNAWLHFIGRSYYSIASFAREAKKVGVSRRIGRQTLCKMNFGDRIVLAQWDGKKAVAFGYFHLSAVGGLPSEVTAKGLEKHGGELAAFGGSLVSRGCGSYVLGNLYTTKANVREICDVIEQASPDALLMIEGQLKVFPAVPVPHKYVYLTRIPHRQGFRLFDWGGFVRAVAEWQPGFKSKYPALKSQFYVFEAGAGSQSGPGSGREIRDYQKKKAAGNKEA